MDKDEEGRSDAAEREAELDAQLVTRVVEGDPSAFDELVRRYQRRVVGVAYRLLGRTDDAADVAQDVLLRAYRSLAQLSDRRRFGPWLMRIATNLSLNYRRSRGASPTVSWDEGITGDEPGRLAEGFVGRAHRPADSAVTEELRTAAAEAIAALPEQQRMALVLFSIEGLSQKEVAEVLDCSVALVKWHVFQARKTIREALADYLT